MAENRLQTDISARNAAAIALRGVWAYKCEVDAGSEPFDHYDRGRGGCMLISAKPSLAQIDVTIVARRFWGTQLSSADVEARSSRPPLAWHATGQVPYHDTESEIRFDYSSGEGYLGETRDSFLLDPIHMELMPGRFVHKRQDGVEVTGEIRLKKLRAPYEIEWSPDKAKVPLPDLVCELGVRLVQALPSKDRQKHANEIYLIDVLTQELVYPAEGRGVEEALAWRKRDPLVQLYNGRVGAEPILRSGIVAGL